MSTTEQARIVALAQLEAAGQLSDSERPDLYCAQGMKHLVAALEEAKQASERLRSEWSAAATVVAMLRTALIWCGGSSDFAPGGVAHEGWQKMMQEAMDVSDAYVRRYQKMVSKEDVARAHQEEVAKREVPANRACLRCGAYTTTGYCSRQCGGY
ncbi:MAG: hypothetical protein ACREMY_05090 [bacterium]